jgi:protein-tyrosine phosphatase
MSNLPNGRIEFDNILNCRDVGAYINHVTDAGLMVNGRLYRSARPDAASPSDRHRLLEELKIKTIIDLRTPTEHIEQARKATTVVPSVPVVATKDPTKQFRMDGITYKDVNFNGDGYKNALMSKLSYWQTAKLVSRYAFGYRKEAISILGTNVMAERGLAGLAIDSLQHCRKEVKEVFEILCDPSSYPVLVHCTQGKDRTGLIILLVLLLCEVPRDVVKADYTLSEPELAPERDEKVEEIRSIGLPDSFADCPQDWTDTVSDYIDSTFGSAAMYLDTCGVTKQQRLYLLDCLSNTTSVKDDS